MSAHPDVIADLERLGLQYEVMDCELDLADTAEFCQAYGVPRPVGRSVLREHRSGREASLVVDAADAHHDARHGDGLHQVDCRADRAAAARRHRIESAGRGDEAGVVDGGLVEPRLGGIELDERGRDVEPVDLAACLLPTGAVGQEQDAAGHHVLDGSGERQGSGQAFDRRSGAEVGAVW